MSIAKVVRKPVSRVNDMMVHALIQIGDTDISTCSHNPVDSYMLYGLDYTNPTHPKLLIPGSMALIPPNKPLNLDWIAAH